MGETGYMYPSPTVIPVTINLFSELRCLFGFLTLFSRKQRARQPNRYPLFLSSEGSHISCYRPGSIIGLKESPISCSCYPFLLFQEDIALLYRAALPKIQPAPSTKEKIITPKRAPAHQSHM